MKIKLSLVLLSFTLTQSIFAVGTQDPITQVLGKIQTNTEITAQATHVTLTKQLQTLLKTQKAQHQKQQTAQSQYVYASQQDRILSDHITHKLNLSLHAYDNAATASDQFAKQTIDQQWLCQQTRFRHTPVCQPQSASTLTYNAVNLLNGNALPDAGKANAYAQHLIEQNLRHATPQQAANASLATMAIGTYLEQHLPTKNTQVSFMSTLQDAVKAPLQANWQKVEDKQSLSDRIRTMNSLLAMQNYLSYLRLQNQQKQTLLLATLTLQHVQLNTKITAQNKAIATLISNQRKPLKTKM